MVLSLPFSSAVKTLTILADRVLVPGPGPIPCPAMGPAPVPAVEHMRYT